MRSPQRGEWPAVPGRAGRSFWESSNLTVQNLGGRLELSGESSPAYAEARSLGTAAGVTGEE